MKQQTEMDCDSEFGAKAGAHDVKWAFIIAGLMTLAVMWVAGLIV